jgi:hypothetical protein
MSNQGFREDLQNAMNLLESKIKLSLLESLLLNLHSLNQEQDKK